MTPLRYIRFLAATCPVVLAIAPASAQMSYVPPATPDADALASEMRLLAANPGDVQAMVRAGELTLKLDDTTAAAGFFARAERIDPNNPRIKAGRGTLLVQSGRPGEALRLFADAEALRGDVRRFAADRGLAYDLIGEQARAQREYRLALLGASSDETLRRYALSLGISGKRDEALQVIDPLLRRSDRGAWRARAFILAMSGDVGGAQRIAASMMPGGLGHGLQPFFQRLPQLSAIDRAFAVHFGEVRGTPQRLADARLAPRLPALAPEPGRPVVVAALTAQPAREDKKSKRERKRRDRDRNRVVVATALPPVPLPQPPAYQGTSVAALDGPAAAPTYRPAYQPPLPSVAMAATRPALPSTGLARRSDVAPMARPAADPNGSIGGGDAATTSIGNVPVRTAPPPAAFVQAVPRPAQTATGVASPPVQQAAATLPSVTPAPPPSASGTGAAAVSVPDNATTLTTAPARTPAATSTTIGVASTVPGPPATTVTIPAAVAAAPAQLPPAPGPAKGEDTILAKIIANITVPGSELEVGAVEQAAPTPLQTAASPVATDAPDAQAVLIAEQKAADRLANEKALAERKAAEKRVADRKLAEAKAAEAKLAEKPKDDDAPALVRKTGESTRQFEARKLAGVRAAAVAADVPVVRKPGETKKQFDARKLATTAAADDAALPIKRKTGETLKQFEARKLAAAASAGAADITRKPGETKKQFDARRLAAAPASGDAAAVVRKPGETTRQFEARKLAAAKKTTVDKKDPKSTEPARIWVQVSGGANEGDLTKAWDKVRKDAPVAMRGRVGWTTPLRATNRVLTGPFKTDAEARSLVNALGKEGVSAFAFTSEAGQKVTRLAGK